MGGCSIVDRKLNGNEKWGINPTDGTATPEVESTDIDPGEQLVLGAKLGCSSGTSPSFLLVYEERMTINEGLLAASAEDNKAGENILPFGTCNQSGQLCAENMYIPKGWENTEVQGVEINGAKIVTTNSYIACEKGGTIQAIDSGQDRLADFAKSEKNYLDLDNLTPEQKDLLKLRALYIKGYLEKKGWKDEAIAAVIGNFTAESYLSPGQHQINGGKGRGLAQWDQDKVADIMGTTSPTELMKKQLDYLIDSFGRGKGEWSEGEKAYRHSYDRILRTYDSTQFINNKQAPRSNIPNDPEVIATSGALARVFATHYERPQSLNTEHKDYDKDKAETSLETRATWADAWHKFLYGDGSDPFIQQ